MKTEEQTWTLDNQPYLNDNDASIRYHKTITKERERLITEALTNEGADLNIELLKDHFRGEPSKGFPGFVTFFYDDKPILMLGAVENKPDTKKMVITYTLKYKVLNEEEEKKKKKTYRLVVS